MLGTGSCFQYCHQCSDCGSSRSVLVSLCLLCDVWCGGISATIVTEVSAWPLVDCEQQHEQ